MDKCANCSLEFKSAGRNISCLILLESESSLSKSNSDSSSQTQNQPAAAAAGSSKAKTVVSTWDAFKSIYSIPPDSGSGTDPVINVCPRCFTLLEKTYRLVMDLSQVRGTDSFFAEKLKERDDLIQKIGSSSKGKDKKSSRSRSDNSSPKRKHTKGKKREAEAVSAGGDSNDDADTTIDPYAKGSSRRSRSLSGKSSTVFRPRGDSANSDKAASKSPSSAKKAKSQEDQSSLESNLKGSRKRKLAPKSTANASTIPESQVLVQPQRSPVTSGRPSRNAKLNAMAFMNVSAENETSTKQILSKKNPVNASTPSALTVNNNIVPTTETDSKNLKFKKGQQKRGVPKAPVPRSRSRQSPEAVLAVPKLSLAPSTAPTASQSQTPPASKSKSKGKKVASKTKAKNVATPPVNADVLPVTTPVSAKSKSKGKKGDKVEATPAQASPALTPGSSRSKKAKAIKVLASKKPKVTANPRGSVKGKGKQKGSDKIPSSARSSISEEVENQVGGTPSQWASTNAAPPKPKGKSSKKKKLASDQNQDTVNFISTTALPLDTIATDTPLPVLGIKSKVSKGQSKSETVAKGKVVKPKITLPKKSKVPKVKVADASTSASPQGFSPPPGAATSKASKNKVKITEMETQTERPSAAALIQLREEALDLTFKALQNKHQQNFSANSNVPSSVAPPLSKSSSASSASLSNSILVPSSGNKSNTSSIIETPKRSKAKLAKSVKFAETVSKLEIPARGNSSSASESPTSQPATTNKPKRNNANKKAGVGVKASKNKKTSAVSGPAEAPVPTSTEITNRQKGGKKNLKKEKEPQSSLTSPKPSLTASSEVLAVKSAPTQNSPREKHPCPQCDYEAPARFNLQRHQIGVHELKDTSGPPFTCAACNMTFSKKANLVVHRMAKTCVLGTVNHAPVNDKVTASNDAQKDKTDKSKTKAKKRKSVQSSVDVAVASMNKDSKTGMSGSDLEPKAKKPKLSKKDKARPVQEKPTVKVEDKMTGKPKPSRKRKKAEMNGEAPVTTKGAVLSKNKNQKLQSRPAVSTNSSSVGVGLPATESLPFELKKDPQMLAPKPEAGVTAATLPSGGSGTGKEVSSPPSGSVASSKTNQLQHLPKGLDTAITSLSSSAAPAPLMDGKKVANANSSLNSSNESTTAVSSGSEETLTLMSTSLSESNLIIDEGQSQSLSTTITMTSSSKGNELLVNSGTAVASGKDSTESKTTLSLPPTTLSVPASSTADKNLVTMTADSTTSGTGSSPDTTNSTGSGTSVGGAGAGAGSGAAVGIGIGA